jgi:hypothetical protein
LLVLVMFLPLYLRLISVPLLLLQSLATMLEVAVEDVARRLDKEDTLPHASAPMVLVQLLDLYYVVGHVLLLVATLLLQMVVMFLAALLPVAALVVVVR